MNLLTILHKSLSLIGLPDDEDTLELWRPRLMHWCNEGLIDLGLTLRPWYRESLSADGDERVYTDDLAYRCVKVLAVKKDGKRLLFYYGSTPFTLIVPGVQKGDPIEILYRYMPRELEDDTDVPELPESVHELLVTYIVGREKSQLDTGAFNVGRYSLALYEKGKKSWIRNQSPPEENQFYNMY